MGETILQKKPSKRNSVANYYSSIFQKKNCLKRLEPLLFIFLHTFISIASQGFKESCLVLLIVLTLIKKIKRNHNQKRMFC